MTTLMTPRVRTLELKRSDNPNPSNIDIYK